MILSRCVSKTINTYIAGEPRVAVVVMEAKTSLRAGLLYSADVECPEEHGNFNPERSLRKRNARAH